MTQDEILRRMVELSEDALRQHLNAPSRPPAADVARALGYDPDAYSSVTWREDGQGIVLIPKILARDIVFTVGPGLVESEDT